MSDSSGNRVEELLELSRTLPFGEERYRIVEEAVRYADQTRAVDELFEAKMELVSVAGFCGHDEQLLTAFSWCLAKFEEDPERFIHRLHSLLWYFKNVLHNVAVFPTISRQQIQEIHGQMAHYYSVCGFNRRPVYYLGFVVALQLGDLELAAQLLPIWQQEPRDEMADCPACEADGVTEYQIIQGNYEEALQVAGPNLSGQRSCAEVPHRVLAYVLRPLVMLGRSEEAERHHIHGYRLIRQNPNYLRHVALHLTYLMDQDRLPEAVEIFQRHLPWSLNTREFRHKYIFLVASAELLRILAEEKSTCKLNLPADFPLHQPSNTYEVAELTGWFQREAAQLGEAFNQRNGNDFYTTTLLDQLLYRR